VELGYSIIYTMYVHEFILNLISQSVHFAPPLASAVHLFVRVAVALLLCCSDVKRGQNLEAEAEANFCRSRPRPRPKIVMKKYQIMTNNIGFKIIAGKFNKISEFYTIFARKCPIKLT